MMIEKPPCPWAKWFLGSISTGEILVDSPMGVMHDVILKVLNKKGDGGDRVSWEDSSNFEAMGQL